MLNEPKNSTELLDHLLDTFFHLPTLLALAIISVVILWQVTDAGLHLGPGYLRLNTNQGNMTLDWSAGCCDLDW